jgi:putative protease
MPELVDADLLLQDRGTDNHGIRGERGGAYRMVLDAPPAKRADVVAEAKELLKLSFGRVPTRGFLASHQPTDIATPSLRGATGRFLGEIRSILKNRLTFETRDRLHLGDRVRVQPKSDKAGKAFTVKDISLGKAGEAGTGKVPRHRHARLTLRSACGVQVSSKPPSMSENACLESSAVERAETRCNLTWPWGRKPRSRPGPGPEWVEEYPLGTWNRPAVRTWKVLRAQFEKCGVAIYLVPERPSFPAVLIRCRAEGDPPHAVPNP